MKTYLEITSFENKEVVHRVDVTGKSERQIEKTEMGMLMRIDLDRFYIVEKQYSVEQPIKNN